MAIQNAVNQKLIFTYGELMPYIIITEDGEPFVSDVLTADMKNSCDDGIMDVIDTENLTQYFNESWSPLPTYSGNTGVFED